MSNTPESRIGAGRIVIDAEHIGFRYRTGPSADVATRERGADGTPSAPPNGMSADISPALDDVTLTIRNGEFVVLCGQSGCGKPRSPGCSTD